MTRRSSRPAEILLDTCVVLDELLPPTIRLELEEGPLVVALRLPCVIALDVSTPAVDPTVDVADREDELATRILAIEQVEVHAEPLDVGVRVVVTEVLEEWLVLTDRALDRSA